MKEAMGIEKCPENCNKVYGLEINNSLKPIIC